MRGLYRYKLFQGHWSRNQKKAHCSAFFYYEWKGICLKWSDTYSNTLISKATVPLIKIDGNSYFILLGRWTKSKLDKAFICCLNKAMYKNRNTGTGNGTRGMGGMLYSGECRQTFRGMAPSIPGNVLKHSGECRQTFRGTLPNIPGSVAKHSGECRKSFWGMSPNILGNILQTFFMFWIAKFNLY